MLNRESVPLFLVLVQPLQATRAAAFANGVKACKGRATTKSGCTSTRARPRSTFLPQFLPDKKEAKPMARFFLCPSRLQIRAFISRKNKRGPNE